MIPLDDAYEIARRWARDLHPDASVRLEPFELGYVAHRSAPEFAGRTGEIIDAEVSIVIDGDTREVTPFAALPTAAVVHLYSAKIAAEKRYPAPLRGLLGLSGWRPARHIGAAVDGWWSRNAPPGKALPAAVRTVVAEFGGLELLPAGLSFMPRPGPCPVRLLDTGAGDAVVVGEAGGQLVAVADDGGVWVREDDVTRKVADGFDAALPQLLGLAG